MKNSLLVRFLLKVTIFYLLLAIPFHFIEVSYSKFYISISKVFFGSINETGVVRFLPDKDGVTVAIQVANSKVRQADGTCPAVVTNANTRLRGYLPMILLVSLILAMPIGGKRKALNLLSGILLVTLFIMFKQWIHVLYTYSRNPFLELYSFAPFQKRMIEFGYENLVKTPGPSLFVVMLIWLSVALRSDGMGKLLNFNSKEL